MLAPDLINVSVNKAVWVLHVMVEILILRQRDAVKAVPDCSLSSEYSGSGVILG